MDVSSFHMKILSGTILVADDDANIREILRDTLNSLGARIVTAVDGQDCLDHVEADVPDVVLLDIEMPVKSGLQVLQDLRRRGSEMTIVVITAYGTIERAVQAMKQGAYDFITKPFDLDHITLVVEKALERERLKRGLEHFSEETGERYRLIGGESPKMRASIETARKAAASRSTVLLLGESGTGKEVFARAIHQWSDRRGETFIAINCVGLSKDLLESELFGHEKGAFTGAHQLKKGKMELADRGTLFLDEVGDISPELQTKLLQFFQEQDFERVGGAQQIRVDVRVIAATNRDLTSAMREGRFREDLYYRLNVIPIALPPLREQKGNLYLYWQSIFCGALPRRPKRILLGSPKMQRRCSSHTNGRGTCASWQTSSSAPLCLGARIRNFRSRFAVINGGSGRKK